jgi:hypothetical protein
VNCGTERFFGTTATVHGVAVPLGVAGAGMEQFGSGQFHERAKDGFAFIFLTGYLWYFIEP